MEQQRTNRSVNLGAELWLHRPIPVLDHGFVRLVDYMGTDKTVVDAARVSYGKAGIIKQDWEDIRLINFLMRERHTSPFEQCVMTFECKMPIFVAREWVRHRTARLNEISGRYTKLPDEVYTPAPDRVQGQDTINKQGSSGELPDAVRREFLWNHEQNTKHVKQDYESAIGKGVAKEVARIDLPLSQYTKWVWQMDLHNLLHFLKLRLAPNAQWEIRQYANAIARVVQASFPWVWEAFDNHVLNSVTLSRDELSALMSVLSVLRGEAVSKLCGDEQQKLLTRLQNTPRIVLTGGVVNEQLPASAPSSQAA